MSVMVVIRSLESFNRLSVPNEILMARNTIELMDIVDSLPIDMKLKLVNRPLESIIPTRDDTSKDWKDEVEHRIE